jgi:2-polyprenyl-3-methyl-5-hydroxy-6-metoxy-1,4-benzoquinol methylase
MFNRVDNTYDINPETIKNILKDEVNPLNRISYLIPENSKVLDIGAGNGLLALVLLETHSKIIIDGIEPNPYASSLAKKNYRNFYCGFAQNFKEIILQENYDFIIMADVIEHIDDPLGFLLDLCSDLSGKTKIILSIPNVAFGAVRISLLNGEFNYVGSGILEKTHVRFFTLNTVEMLISNLNMNLEKLYFLQRNIFNSEIDLEKFGFNVCYLSNIFNNELASTYQFLLVLTKEHVTTEKRYFGTRNKSPFISYIFRKFGAIKLFRKQKSGD